LTAAPAAEAPAEHRIEIEALTGDVWLHTSFRDLEGYPRFSSNGLVVATEDGAVVIDTAWTEAQTIQLLDWTEANVGAVRAVYVTHWHIDRTAGLAEVHRRGIPSFGGRRTRALALANGSMAPQRSVPDRQPLAPAGVRGELFYPGAGHTTDNAVVWLDDARILFGGCLVKSASDGGLGYTDDADLGAWDGTLARVAERYPGALVVVPGHGAPGDLGLIDHSMALVEAHRAAAAAAR
jgi:glyoxylase-like metal-dependent hydrolase (beta-lactamase superfamily II)